MLVIGVETDEFAVVVPYPQLVGRRRIANPMGITHQEYLLHQPLSAGPMYSPVCVHRTTGGHGGHGSAGAGGGVAPAAAPAAGAAGAAGAGGGVGRADGGGPATA